MKFIIFNAKEKYKDVTDATIFWGMVKMEISLGFSLFNSSKKKCQGQNKYGAGTSSKTWESEC